MMDEWVSGTTLYEVSGDFYWWPQMPGLHLSKRTTAISKPLRGKHQALSSQWEDMTTARMGCRKEEKGQKPHLSIVSELACMNRWLQLWFLQSDFDRRQKERSNSEHGPWSETDCSYTTWVNLIAHHQRDITIIQLLGFGRINEHSVWDTPSHALTHRDISHFQSS